MQYDSVDPYTVALLKKLEGFSPRAYGDYKQTSIGYGTRAMPGEQMIDPSTAEARLISEAQGPAALIDRTLPGIDPRKRAALISFGYNLGTGKGGLSDLIPSAQAGDWQSVASKMQRYVNAGGKPNEGLINRRATEANLISQDNGGGNMTPVSLLTEALRRKAAIGTPQAAAATTQNAAPMQKVGGTSAADYRRNAAELQSRNAALLANPTHWAQPLAAILNSAIAGYDKRQAQEQESKTAEEIAAQTQNKIAQALILSRDPEAMRAGVEMIVRQQYEAQEPPKTMTYSQGNDEFGNPLPSKTVAWNKDTRQWEPFTFGDAQATPRQPVQTQPQQQIDLPSGSVEKTESGERYTGPVLKNEVVNLDQPTSVSTYSVNEAGEMKQPKTGLRVGPAAKNVGEGYIQRVDPNGGFLWRDVNGKLVPDVVLKPDDTGLERRASGAGLEPGTPEYKEFMRTGGEKPLTVTDKKAILDAEDKLEANKTAIDYLTQALKLNDKAYQGPGASMRGWLSSTLSDSEAGEATQDLENIVQSQALPNLKSTFGGNPTEGERKILLDIQGSVNQSPAVRKAIWERAISLANKRAERNKVELDQIRAGTYFKSGGGASGSESFAKIPSGAIEALKSKPELREEFNAKYGSGSAERILGGE